MKYDVDTLHMLGVPSSDGNGRKPVNLPEIKKSEHNPFDIATRLNSGQALIGWFFLSTPDGDNDNFWMYRVENDLLCKYYLWLSSDEHIPFTKLEYVWNMSPDAVKALYDAELEAFPHIYYDKEQDFIAKLKTLVHDVTREEIKEYLKTHSVFVVNENRFKKKDA